MLKKTVKNPTLGGTGFSSLSGRLTVTARSVSDAAVHGAMDCHAALAMTPMLTPI